MANSYISVYDRVTATYKKVRNFLLTVDGESVNAQGVTVCDASSADRTLAVAADGSIATTSALGATAAHQVIAQTSLSSLDTKTPALGQAVAAGSVPVVLTAAQLSTLTPPAAITGFATEASISPATSANNQGSTVSIPASNTLALAAFSTRKGGTIYAPDTNTQIVYVSLGGTATSSGIPLSPGASMPLNQGSGAYAGAVNALSASGTQALIVVEW